ncbi:hypothetical protein NBRC116592_21530 [Colwellia sp. KU-HH00111]|uniref:hypothetical protein n=1 Tax=Colwellia sp. KU-HH00111 TaxID=3127652 RepID=UPI0031093FB6
MAILKEANKNKLSTLKVDSNTEDAINESTPQEQLYSSFENIRLSVYNEILDTIISKSSYDLEHLVVNLLDKMGYKGQVKDAGSVTQASNDGGLTVILKKIFLG